IILAMVLLREYRPEGRTRFDFIGFFFAAIGLATMLYALSSASTDGWTSGTVLGFLLVGLIFLSLFVTAEIIIANRGGQPLLDLRLFANGPFRTSIIASVFVIFCLFSGLFIFTVRKSTRLNSSHQII